MQNELDILIKDFIKKTTFTVEDIEVAFDEETGSYWYQVRTTEPRYFIGRNGETLQAINHLAKKMVEKNLGENTPSIEYFIDVNNFQKKRIDTLKQMAHMMAERARFFKSSIEVDPMSAYDRKIIHMYLQNKTDLATESVGEGRDRRVVIKYIGTI